MPLEGSSEQETEDSEPEFVEVDPTGRYGRYKEVLGKGAFKKVYRAFDELEGIEVAWNQVKVSELLRNSEDLERLYSEVHLLKTLKHKNIIKFYNSWIDTTKEHINFITEIFTSGTLRQYRKKHKRVDLRALKKWSRQILEGLLYLHSHDPPIIHRDLKCDNIFVNGNHGEVKIGDLGLAAILHHANAAHSVIGTPEFMAPELYEEEYNELVDIYAFGMCLLELVTFEYPYVECINAAQIYKKVTTGIKPASFGKVMDPSVKAFIEKCIAHLPDRLSARELLQDPFLSDLDPEGSCRPLQVNLRPSDATHNQSAIGEKRVEDSHLVPSRDLTVQGELKDVNTIFIKLKIAVSTGNSRNIHFPFDIEADTSIAVASEMVHELDLTDQDIPTIADMIDSEIRALIPDWSPRDSSAGESTFDSHPSENKYEGSPLRLSESKDDIPDSPRTNASPFSGSLFPDQLPSGRRFWSDSPKTGDGLSPRIGGGLSPIKSNPTSPSDFHSDTSEDQVYRHMHLRPKRGNSSLYDETHEEMIDELAETGDSFTANKNNSPDGVSSDMRSKDDSGSREKCSSKKKDIAPAVVQNFECDERGNKGRAYNIELDRIECSSKKKDIASAVVQNYERDELGKKGRADNIELDREECSSEQKDIAPVVVQNFESDELGKKGRAYNVELDEVSAIAEKLDRLLSVQQKELDELKRKHELAVSRILEELSPQMRQMVLCLRKVSDYRMNHELNLYYGHTTPPGSHDLSLDYSSSMPANRIFTRSVSTIDLSISPIRYLTANKVGKHGVEGEGQSYMDNLNSFKKESKSDGIAIILNDSGNRS